MSGKNVEVDMEALESEMLEALRPCANAFELNGTAFYMLAQEIAAAGKPIGEVTLAELAQLYDQVGQRYNTMSDRVRNLMGAADENDV